MVKFLLAAMALLFSTQAFADLKSDLAKCAAKPGDGARLVCYDALAHRLGVDRATIVANDGAGKWDVSTETSPIDDSTNVYLHLEAQGPVHSGYNTVTPTLVIRCAQKETNVFINWGLYLGLDSTDVLTRVDKEKARTNSWAISTDTKAIFVQGSDVAYARSLMGHQTLLVEVTPYNESPVMAEFNISGLDQAIQPLRKACNW